MKYLLLIAAIAGSVAGSVAGSAATNCFRCFGPTKKDNPEDNVPVLEDPPNYPKTDSELAREYHFLLFNPNPFDNLNPRETRQKVAFLHRAYTDRGVYLDFETTFEQRDLIKRVHALSQLSRCTTANDAQFDELISACSDNKNLLELVKWEREEYLRVCPL